MQVEAQRGANANSVSRHGPKRFESVTVGTASTPERCAVMSDRQIVAVGLLTAYELQLLGVGFSRAWPIDDTPCFEGLLEAIDDAEREMWRGRDEETAGAV